MPKQLKPRRCAATRTDGQPCGAPALTDKPFCFWHDPGSREARLDASARGGAVPRRLAELPEAEPLTIERSRAILAGALEAVVQGSLDAGTARAVGYLLQIEGKLRESHELTERIEALERIAKVATMKRSG